jgi:hypothetical protein
MCRLYNAERRAASTPGIPTSCVHLRPLRPLRPPQVKQGYDALLSVWQDEVMPCFFVSPARPVKAVASTADAAADSGPAGRPPSPWSP